MYKLFIHKYISYFNLCLFVLIDKLSVSTRPARLAALSSNDVKQLKPVTRSSGSLVNQQPAKRMCQSLAVDFLPSDALLSPATSNKVQY